MYRAIRITGLILAAALGIGSCYHDDYYPCCGDAIETIRFENYTTLDVDNFIDRNFVGTVPAGGALELNGNYEGRHLFESKTDRDVMHWGPDEFDIFDGDLFVLELNPQGGYKVMRTSRAESK